jgi:hypothetical protein
VIVIPPTPKIQHPSNFEAAYVKDQRTQEAQANQSSSKVPVAKTCHNCGEDNHFAIKSRNPCQPHTPIGTTNSSPTPKAKFVKVCFNCRQRGHFALKCPNQCQQWTSTQGMTLAPMSHLGGNSTPSLSNQNAIQTPPDKKFYDCEEKGHFAITCPNPCACPPLPL